MAYLMVRRTKNKTTGSREYVVTLVSKDDQNKKSEKALNETALEANGFKLTWDYETAHKHGLKLNALDAVRRKDVAAKVRAAERLTDIITVENSVIPAEESEEFVIHMEEKWSGKSNYNLRKQVQHWALVQTMLTKNVKVLPHEYYKNSHKFYAHFAKQGYSISYAQKILKVLNMWGEFNADKNQKYFKKVPNPKGTWLEKITEASDAEGVGAAPLDLNVLESMKMKMPINQWNYIRATLWLGLRPSELDEILKNKESFEVSKTQGITVISVYQSKLIMIPKPKRWKMIPCYHEEMKEAVDQIVSCYKDPENPLIKKPLVKTLKKAAPEVDGIGLYSGRKGFTDLHLDLGQELEDISQWAGHSNIQRTWAVYKNKFKVKFNPIKKGRAG